MAVGDKVSYVPGVEYAKDRGRNGFAWAFGRRKALGSDEVEEISDKLAEGLMMLIRRQPNKADLLVALAPKEPWAATLVKDRGDGSADLDVAHPAGGVTLHLTAVPHDPKGVAGAYFTEGDAEG